jgi:hypothetical protein
VDGLTGRADQPRHRPARAAAVPPREVIRRAYLHRAGGRYCQQHGARFAARTPRGQVTITSYDPDGDGIVVTVHEEGPVQVAGEGVNAA